MEREYIMHFYSMGDGDVGIILVCQWDGRAYTNMDTISKREGSTGVSTDHELFGEKHLEDITHNQLRTLTDTFELFNEIA